MLEKSIIVSDAHKLFIDFKNISLCLKEKMNYKMSEVIVSFINEYVG